MQIAQQLHAAGLDVFPCRADKSPAVAKGQSWAEVAKQSPESLQWPSGVVGVPVPPGVVVLDLDTYKGVTREQVDALLGCSLPWDRALIQTTQRGGQHYAFKAPHWTVRQDANIGVNGFDTRVGGKGYIATGAGYTPAAFGVYALAHPEALPTLPDACRATLERVQRSIEHTPLPEGDKDAQTIKDALSRIPPDVGRSEWMRVGLALRHQFHDDEATGLTLFDQWSSGQLSPTSEAPPNYAGPDDIEHQFTSFKPEGGTTISTLFYAAMQNGWRPPAGIDVSSAFGPGAAPVDAFCDMIDRMRSHGSNPEMTSELIAALGVMPCDQLQRATLASILMFELKEEGLLSKAVKQQIEKLTGGGQTSLPGRYGKNDTENAAVFMDNNYPDNTLVVSDQTWFKYTGKAWEQTTEDAVKSHIARDMAPVRPMASHISGAFKMVAHLAHNHSHKIGVISDDLILFQNGILNLLTGDLSPHSPAYFTTNIRPYDFNRDATCHRWLQFLHDTMEGDAERISLLQEWFGYMITRSYRHHKIMLMIGPKRCGKSTIGKVLAGVVGEQNFTGGSLHSFTTDSYIDSLRTKQVVFIGDAEKHVNRNTQGQVIERLKTISGNDQVTFDRKFKSTLSEVLPCRITVAANHLPGLFDDSGALASRMLLLPFNVSYINREDLGLGDAVMAEIEGIAMWSLQGMARLNTQAGFTTPQASRDELEYLSEAYSPMQQFFQGACTVNRDDQGVSSADLYNAYRNWALANQEDNLLTKRTFISAFKDIIRGTPCSYAKYRYGGASNPLWGFRHITTEVETIAGAAFAPGLKVVK